MLLGIRMWHEEWNGLPSEEFLVQLDPMLAGMRERYNPATYTSDEIAGYLTPEWGQKLGSTPGIPVVVEPLMLIWELSAVVLEKRPWSRSWELPLVML